MCSRVREKSKLSVLPVVLLSLSAGVFQLLNAQTPVRTESPSTQNYAVGAGDVLKIFILKQDALSQEGVRVGNDGTIRMPMLAEPIAVNCLTEAEIARELTNRYKKYILDPQVYVSVKEFNANPVSIVGAVIAPATLQLQRPLRLLELLTLAKGPAANAGSSLQIIHSFDPGACARSPLSASGTPVPVEARGAQIVSIPLADVLKGGEAANPFVQPGDIVRIEEAEARQAFVIGNVKTAATISLKEPVTLSRAIAMAGGASKGAQIDKIRISRQSPGSLTPTDVIVSLKEINNRKREDIVLQNNDIVDVPGPSGTRAFLTGLVKGIIPAVTRVPVYIP